LISLLFFFFSSRRRHTRSKRDWSSDVCSSDLSLFPSILGELQPLHTSAYLHLENEYKTHQSTPSVNVPYSPAPLALGNPDDYQIQRHRHCNDGLLLTPVRLDYAPPVQ